MANPNMKKGAPSVNPAGRAFAKKNAIGSDGVLSFGGYLNTGETNAKLTGRRRWVEYSNTYQRPPVAIAAFLRAALFAGASWSLNENEAGGRGARKGVDVIQRGLLDARMVKPWPVVVKKAGNCNFFEGFSLQATAIARRPDGLVAFTEISSRPAHTINRWIRVDPTVPFDTVEQRLDTGQTYLIPLSESFYLVNDTISESPEGVGMLRLIVERCRRVGLYEDLEGSEMFSGMGGTPIARVPLEELKEGLTGTADEIQAKLKAKVSSIETVVSDRVKTPEKRQYVVLSSATYQGVDGNTISPEKKWDIEIVKGDLQGLEAGRKIITDIDLDIARMLGVDFMFSGGAGALDGGAGRHESQISLFAAQLSADGDLIARQGTDQLCRRLIAANGLDPDTCTPTLVMSPISTEDVLKTCNALVQLNMAGLTPNHPAKKAVFDRLNLPWEDEPEPVLPRGPVPPVPSPGVEVSADGTPPKRDDSADPDPADIEEGEAPK